MRVIRDNIQKYYNIYIILCVEPRVPGIRVRIIIIARYIAAGTYSLQSLSVQ